MIGGLSLWLHAATKTPISTNELLSPIEPEYEPRVA
jgi:hypothetical protein